MTYRGTSGEAYDGVRPKVPSIRSRVLAELEKGPATEDELEVRLGLAHQTCGPRITELCDDNKITDSGQRRKTERDYDAIVWRLRVESDPPNARRQVCGKRVAEAVNWILTTIRTREAQEASEPLAALREEIQKQYAEVLRQHMNGTRRGGVA